MIEEFIEAVKWNTPDVFLTVEIGSIPDDFSQVIHLQTGPKLDWIHRPAMCITWDFLTPSSFVYGCILTWFLWGHWMWQSRSYLCLDTATEQVYQVTVTME
jgi:hypothetical protein